MKLSPAHERYRLFVCSDCHPDNIDEDTPEDERHALPYEVLVPVGSGAGLVSDRPDVACPVDTCPRCDSHLSLCAEDVVTLARLPRPGAPFTDLGEVR